MRTRLAAVLMTVLTLAGLCAAQRVQASPADEYTGTHFGAGNVPLGCEADSLVSYTDNVCYHQRTGMNGLDSPKVNVLILVPATPTAERDARIVRQAIEMWDGGIQNLGPQMGLDWMSGMRFNIHVAALDLANSEGFNPYPIADPDIVVVSTTNPAGGLGIGIDPLKTAGELAQILAPEAPFTGEAPCTGIANPFDMEAWQAVPGFDAHHGDESGTYTQDCAGVGGNVCFAVNTALDPAPDTIEIVSLFDLVAHEVGHCLTIGHVGDGAEGAWGKVPTNDIMSYNADPAELNKCVSTLDVESIAVTMSNYLDTNADGVVNEADRLDANDQPGDGRNAFQTQHPRDHFYASGTGKPTDCPQPDLGLLPGPRTNWQPAPVATSRNVLTLTSPTDNATTPDGNLRVTGTVERQAVVDPEPTASSASYDDADDDATSPLTEITSFSTAVTESTVDAIVNVAQVPPAGSNVTSPTTYSLSVDGRRFDSFVLSNGVATWDNSAGAYIDDSASSWDTAANTVTFRIPRSYLADQGITAPYQVRAEAYNGNVTLVSRDDSAPDGRATLGLAAPASSNARVGTVHVPVLGASTQTVTFENENGNTFYAEDSTLGATNGTPVDASHLYQLELPQTSDVVLTLEWTDGLTGTSDLDLAVTHDGVTDTATGGTTANPEKVTLTAVSGLVDLAVVPYLVTEEIDGVTYTLTADITTTGVEPVDTDGDGVPDTDDVCPTEAGDGANGCPIAASDKVVLIIDDVVVAEQVVDPSNGPDDFSFDTTLTSGQHRVRVAWLRYGKVVASETRSVTSGTTTEPDKQKDKDKDKDKPKPPSGVLALARVPLP